MHSAQSQREPSWKAQYLPKSLDGREAGDAEMIPFGHGRYQVVCLFNSVLAGATLFYHLFTVRLTTHVADHWCRPPDAFANMSADQWKELAIPLEEDGTRSRCTRRDPADAGDDANIIPCREWDFDLSDTGQSVVSQWQLVCERSWLLDASYYISFTSSVIWMPVLGNAADRAGRKIVVYFSTPALIISSFGSVLTRSFLFFSAMRLVMSATTAGLAVVLLIILYEATERSRRAAFCIGSLALSFFCSIVPFLVVMRLRLDWQTSYLVAMVPASLHVALLYTVDESYLWLMATWHTKAAQCVALQAAKINGVSSDQCWAAMSQAAEASVRDVNAASDAKPEHRKTPSIFSREFIGSSLLLCYTWSASSFCYTLMVLSGAFPLNLNASSIATLFIMPLFAACYWAVSHMGTKTTISGGSLLISITSLLIAGAHSTLAGSFLGTVIVLSLRVAVIVHVSFCLYLPILYYPTETRCSGISFSLCVGRLVGNTGELLIRHYAPGQMQELGAAIQGALMALTAVAIQFLPDRLDDEKRDFTARATSSNIVHFIRKEGCLALRDTLLPRPVGAMRRRVQ